MILYCTNCLNMTTRPNVKFTPSGLCLPCDQYQHPSKINWAQRLTELEEIKNFARDHATSGYDCIIGVSGGKDSTVQALFVRDTLKLKPLLVSMNYPPDQISELGVKNLSNLIDLGFDCLSISCSPIVWKNLMKVGFYKFGNWAKSTELALFSSVPRIAIAYQIPLIWWGENASVQLGDMQVGGEIASDGNRLKYSNTLDGGNLDWLLSTGLKRNQILQFEYPSDQEMSRAGLRIVFLGHFIKDFTIFSNGNRAALRGISVKEPSVTDADFWGTSMLDEDFFTVNMMIKWLKFGFGRANDNVNEEIRCGRMSREEAIEIVDKFDGACPPEVIEKFCSFIDITSEEFWRVVDSYVNLDLFERIERGVYKRKFEVGKH
jgi:N-acetyl sugar amidotransferase